MKAVTIRAVGAAMTVAAAFACRDGQPGLTSLERGPAQGFLAQAVQPSGVVFHSDSSSSTATACWHDGSIEGCVALSRSRLDQGPPQNFLAYSVQTCVPSDSTPGDSLNASAYPVAADSAPGDSVPGDSVPPPPPPACTLIEAGFGRVPSGDVRSGSAQVAGILTNTSAEANPDFTRLAGSGGIVSVDWRAAGDSVTRFHTSQTFRFGNFLFHFNGSSVFSPAAVQGSVVGWPIQGTVSATLGSSQALSIGVEQGP